MQHVAKILKLNQPKTCSGTQASQSQPTNKQSNQNNPTHRKTTSSNSIDANNQSQRIEVMFSRFAAFYGHVWRSQFINEGFLEFSKKEWREGLSLFSDEVLNTAAIHCRDFYEMPPSLPQVITLCRQIKKRTEFYVVNHEAPTANMEVVNLHLKRCKEILFTQ